jgi:regulator of sigma E protease
MSWLLAFAGFAALIILHEFGHFIAAKAFGIDDASTATTRLKR